MAHTISHKAKAPVKANPGTPAPVKTNPDAPATGKEALLRLLERTGDIVADLHEDFLDVYEMLDPEPRPLPETVNPAVIMTTCSLHDEAEAVQKGAEAFGRTVEEFHQAARRAQSLLAGGRNSRAWKVILERVEGETFSHVDAVHNATAGLLRHMRTVAALVTFAQADTLPVSIGKEEEAGNE